MFSKYCFISLSIAFNAQNSFWEHETFFWRSVFGRFGYIYSIVCVIGPSNGAVWVARSELLKGDDGEKQDVKGFFLQRTYVCFLYVPMEILPSATVIEIPTTNTLSGENRRRLFRFTCLGQQHAY